MFIYTNILSKLKNGMFMIIRILFFFLVWASPAYTSHELQKKHPLHNTLSTLFNDPTIAASRPLLEKAGFRLYAHNHRGIVIAEHPHLKGYLLKFFINDVPQILQRHNLEERVAGSRALRSYIRAHTLTKIVVPQKWLFTLTDGTPILVVEKIDIIESSDALVRAYRSIDPSLLDELCQVVKQFRGLDSVLKNMPFTKEGKIAFIDTEKWKSQRSGFLHYVRPLLNDKQKQVVARYYEDAIDRYLLPDTHPLYTKLRKLFSDTALFDSPETLRQRGFEVHKRMHKNLMVFTHHTVEGFIFKRLTNSVKHTKQLELYLRRLKGAELIRSVIKEHHMQNILVPKKWLFKLPYSKDEYLVVAERFDICSGDDLPTGENVRRYKNIDLDTLREYCTVMKIVGGCDAWPRNQPFTKEGKIVFLDTEHVGQKEAHFQRHILPLLDHKRQEHAMRWFLE